MRKKAGFVLRALGGTLVAAVAVCSMVFLQYATTEFASAPLPIYFSLNPGSSLRSASQQMEQGGALRGAAWFVLMARLLGEAGNIKAGEYEIQAPVSPYRLLQKVVAGKVTQASVTFVEGWTFKQMRKVLDEHPSLTHRTRELSDAEILERLGVNETSPEGLFFPDTYYFGIGNSDLYILRHAFRLMQSHLNAQWEKRSPNTPLASPYQALILASIVEKESGRAEDRPLVAAVFANRLRKGMLLQADPTVIYGLGDSFDGNLRKRDLVTDTPYNTYTRGGLPPTPIASPGLASLVATLNPPDSNALYFVARGDGTSHFSRTLGEHENAVTKYQRSGKR